MNRLRQVPGLLRTIEGRNKIRRALYYIAFPLIGPLARFYRRTVLRRTRIVAVVGSYGKTTTRMITAAALGDRQRDHRKKLAAAIFAMPWGHPHAVFEVGIERRGQMAPLARALSPDIVIVTTVGTEHLRSLKTLEGTREEKADMVRELSPEGLAILNGDDAHVMWMATQTRARVLTFGLGENCDVRASDILLEFPTGLSFLVHASGQSQRIRTAFWGRHSVSPFLAAAAAASSQGVTLEEFARLVEPLEPVHGRMHTVQLANGAVLLCDYFKSSFETMHAALDTLAEIPAKRRIAVLGDIESPPASPAQTYGVLGERLAQIADKAIIVGRCFRRYRAGALRAGMAMTALLDAGEFVSAATDLLRQDLQPGDVVLVKGRGTQRLDRIALALQGKTVLCSLIQCGLREPRCGQCSRLEQGWDGMDAVT